jgi:hypothetical protein
MKFGMSFDWISPAIAIVQNIRNHPSVGYNIPVGCGYSAWETKRFLRSRGVKVWGVMIIGDVFTLRVRLGQAEYTQHWLEKMGIAYQGGVAKGASRKAKRTKKTKKAKRSLLQRAWDAL